MKYNFNKDTKIYVAGHKGLIGSAFLRFFNKNGYTNIITKDRDKLDLASKEDTYNFFNKMRPEVVILAAGKVAGIIQNRDFPADFINENLSIQLNVFNAAQKFGIKRLIFFASSCMYPRDTMQPMHENQLSTGHPEPTSIAYASAKFAGVQMCLAFNRQNGLVSFIPVIPNSVYGPNDNFDPNSSHVLSALIWRFHEAKKDNKSFVTLWGTGSPRREFIFSDDVANACCMMLETSIKEKDLPINIGVGTDISIKGLAEKISHIVGFSGAIRWDKSIGWKPQTDLEIGIKSTYQWYIDNIA